MQTLFNPEVPKWSMKSKIFFAIIGILAFVGTIVGLVHHFKR
jgi:hypothetical protein